MVKVLVSMDERLLARIERAAKESGLSRSAYLSRLAAKQMQSASGPGRDRKVRRALKRLDALFGASSVPEDATAAIRAERDAR
jgi:metal-responsive CopG/Arc/MetJ family transcriptional regulator